MKARRFWQMTLAVLCAAVLCAAGAAAEGAGLPVPNEADLVFAELAKTELISSSGAGAWEGRLQIDADGFFSGYYYDADAESEEQVVFTGSLGSVSRVSDTTYRMFVFTADTERVPGTTEVDEDGRTITYIDTLLPEGAELLVTFPGTPDELIPETVKGLIGGTFWEWDDYSGFVTVTLTGEDGWGFFARADLVSPALAGSPAGPVPGMITEQAPSRNPSSALRPIDGKPGCLQMPVQSVTASSWIVNVNDPRMFVPENMLDGQETTCWQFSTGETKLGDAYIAVTFASPMSVDELWIKNGFWKITDGKDQYERNSRLKTIVVDYQYGGAADYRDAETITLADDKARLDWQAVPLSCGDGVTGIRIRILDTYKGSKYKTDVAVSELMFVQREY